ncbi:UNVERIFIED_CONTAM: Transcription factor [Sesamum angustifolium]|uniref:Transcription factor n=1 Tax=Sesamum angustifolium TaxID=2727405 RepID=A0AAW2NJC2_9LAMI
MGLEDPCFTDQFDFLNSFDEDLAAVLGQEFGTCLSPGNHFSSNIITLMETPSEPPPKLQKPNNFSNFWTIQGRPNRDRASSTPIILNFGSANPPENPRQESPRHSNPDDEAYNIVSEILRSEEQTECAQNLKKPSRVRRLPSQTYDHIIAERKRREQLSHSGDAIKYLKYLQDRVKTLEEKAVKKTMESVVLVKKSQIVDDEDEKKRNSGEQPLPEIEARVCNGQILIRVLCENQKGLLTLEKLNLTVVNTNATSFGNLPLFTISEMEKEFNLTVNEVVKALHAALHPPCFLDVNEDKKLA